ncbi:hypothetical protein [Vibrio lentus]|uniref:Uncharacterized protein n=1 Tax=Vibrio lentus TaxID=136468 RepID=A0A2N7BT58_9VIBR|nr:hypothetical protein [Vibrio lentus]PME54320.1 hypothetical protein BCV34_05065 [Vibrio lentus]PME62906.1 hypothetical protein BCV30_09825 [Vibrio lentus]PME77618.1 hypothetical protein BCV27_18780 [Vibrio lentus]PMG76718.1 hypothetical protein BCU86_02540 [Vibrio lentus]PMH92311.1 hypothetical protein BCU56_01035 [Vibrio lentus]
MTKHLFTLNSYSEKPSLQQVLDEFALQPQDVDSEFGVQMIDPIAGTYCILVEEKAIHAINGSEKLDGPYSNPIIETFGPPDSNNEDDLSSKE